MPLPRALAQWKSRAKLLRNRLSTWYASRFLRFTPEDLRARLEALGVRPGDTLIVHSAYSHFQGFTGNPLDVIRLLQDLLGPEGTLLMPNQPFPGSALDWAASGAVWDQRRTPAATGLLPEYFRRLPGVVRSLHPTHSVAGWGRRVPELFKDHLLAKTPCGAGSPYLRLLDCNGKILHLGSSFRTTTFLHGVEELLEPVMPRSALTAETYRLPARDLHGVEHTAECRLYEAEMSHARDVDRLRPELVRRGQWRETRISRLTLLLLDANELWLVARDLAARGVFFYDFRMLKVPPQVKMPAAHE